MRVFLLAIVGLCPLVAQSFKAIPLDPAHLKLSNVKAEKVTYKGRAALLVTDDGTPRTADGSHVAVLTGIEFADGTIEADIAGDRLPGAVEAVRGFSGILFRAQPDGKTYECFYLRPFNGRSEDQLQRNHSAQYISHPEWGWRKLREQFPAKYETYVDLVPGEWNKVRIEVKGDKARLYVNGTQQPTLIVNDLKHGVSKGALGLFIDTGVIAHFANLRVSP